MPTVNSADFQIATNGNLRRAASPATTDIYNVLDLHAWLQDLADNSVASGDDNLSIRKRNPSELAGKRNATRPSALTLLNGVNIDDTVAQFLKFGSVEQDSGNVLYTGLKSIGSPLVAASPIYIVQGTSKVTRWWGAASGHIQILLKCKTGGALISSGDVTGYSRKHGQTFAHFDANLAAGGEQVLALSTQLDGAITMSAGNFSGGTNTITLTTPAGVVTLTFADTTQSLGGVSKDYKGTISWTNSMRLSDVYQALQWGCSESSTATFNSVPGWRYRALDQARGIGSTYVEVPAAPFGTFSGGKLFAAQGWWIATGSLNAADLKAYQLISHDGTVVTPPSSAVVSIGNLVVGDRVLVGKDDGAGDFNVTTGITASGSAAATTVTLSGAPASDVPTGAGFISINDNPHTYTGISGVTVSGLSPAVPGGGYSGAAVWFPLIDTTADTTTESSGNFVMGSGASFVARVRVRNSAIPIVPYETTFDVTEAGGGGSNNTIRDVE
jgi:hypothetical protein